MKSRNNSKAEIKLLQERIVQLENATKEIDKELDEKKAELEEEEANFKELYEEKELEKREFQTLITLHLKRIEELSNPSERKKQE